MKIYLTGQNNFGNRGCEALVRSTVDVIRARLPEAEFFVPSGDIARDSAQWPDAAVCGVHFVPAAPIPARFIQWSRVCSRLPLLAGLSWPRLREAELAPAIREADMILSIGGDNYSLDYDLGSLAYFVAVAEAGLQRKLPVMLWGASVGPFDAMPAVEKKMRAHLQGLSRVTVRESHSVRYLAQIGVAANVSAVVDSAFALRAEALDVSAFWPEEAGAGVLGLNLSQLVETVRARAGSRSALLDEAEHFVRSAVLEQGLSVLLVPHVAPLDGGAHNNDEKFLAGLGARLADLGGRVRQVPGGMNAVQLKYIIGRCRFFIGARTHATIAALSLGVPTLSIAYSIKALGINRDLFGHERYVLDTRQLDAGSLAAGLTRLLAEEMEIRGVLEKQIPVWKNSATIGVEFVLALNK